MKLRINAHEMEISEKLKAYVLLYNAFQRGGISAATKFEKAYYGSKSFDDAWAKFQEQAVSLVEAQCENACGILFNAGFVTVDVNEFIKRYYYDYFDITPHIEPILSALSEISEYSEELELVRNIKRINRTHWVGGGYGVRGAVSGAFTAATFNAVGGALHSVGDVLRKSSDNVKIKNMKHAIFVDSRTCQILCDALIKCNDGIFYALAKESCLDLCLDEISFNPHTARIMSENAQKYAESPSQKADLLIDSVFLDPFNEELYLPLYSDASRYIGLEAFASFFGIPDKLAYQKNSRVNAGIFDCDRKYGNTTKDLCKKIVDFARLAEREGVDLDYRIWPIAKAICKENEHSQRQFSIAIEIITGSFQGSKPLIITKVLNEFKKHYRDLRMTDELDAIQKMSVYNLETSAKKIGALINHGKQYGVPVNKEIDDVVNKAISFCNEKKDFATLREHISQLDISFYPALNTLIRGCDFKIRLYEQEDVLQWHLVHLQTPDILDIIDLARKGNSVCQLWLVRSLVPDVLLRDSVPDDGIIVEGIHQYIPQNFDDAISFLFDAPQTYSFDLLMRLRVNISEEKRSDYAGVLERFANDKTCPAGIYEYGKYTYLSGKVSGLASIEMAAVYGYFPAIAFINKLDASERNALRIPFLLYQVMYAGRSNYSSLYQFQYKDGESYAKLASTLAVMLNLSNGYTSAYTSGVTSVSKFLEAVWHTGYSNATELNIHKIGFHRAKKEDSNIVAAIDFLERKLSHETPVFSFIIDWRAQDKKYKYIDQKVFLLTTKAAYWNKKDTIYTYSFEKPFNGCHSFPDHYATTVQKMWWQCFSIVYYSMLPYKPDISEKVLEKMALCGNPWAICRMLLSSSTSDDRKHYWVQAKHRWEGSGMFFGICPECHQKIEQNDTVCPKCGRRVK